MDFQQIINVCVFNVFFFFFILKSKQKLTKSLLNLQIDGKLLCWLCTLSFKRTLAKARQGEKDGGRIVKKRSHTDKPQINQHQHKEVNYKKPQRPDITKQVMPDIPEKVARIASSMDSNNSDHFIAMTELKETIANMQKRLSQKDRELLEKDKMVISSINFFYYFFFYINFFFPDN